MDLPNAKGVETQHPFLILTISFLESQKFEILKFHPFPRVHKQP